MIAQLPDAQPRFAVADRIKQGAHVLLAAVHAAVAVLGDYVVGKEIEHGIPVGAIQVVAILALQPLDLDGVGEALGAHQQLVDARGIRGSRMPAAGSSNATRHFDRTASAVRRPRLDTIVIPLQALQLSGSTGNTRVVARFRQVDAVSMRLAPLPGPPGPPRPAGEGGST